MNAQKRERIRNFTNTNGYKDADIAEYIERVAPELRFDEKKARHKNMNLWLNGLLNHTRPGKHTAIAKPSETKKNEFDREVWRALALGLGEDAVTLEDLADYYAENALETQKEQEARGGGLGVHAFFASDTGRKAGHTGIDREKRPNCRGGQNF